MHHSDASQTPDRPKPRYLQPPHLHRSPACPTRLSPARHSPAPSLFVPLPPPPQVKDVQITATCIRVPVMRAHAESINLTFKDPMDENKALELLSKAKGVSIINDRANNRFPTPLDASNKDDVYVGRIRNDVSQPTGKGLDIFVCGDQIRKVRAPAPTVPERRASPAFPERLEAEAAS